MRFSITATIVALVSLLPACRTAYVQDKSLTPENGAMIRIKSRRLEGRFGSANLGIYGGDLECPDLLSPSTSRGFRGTLDLGRAPDQTIVVPVDGPVVLRLNWLYVGLIATKRCSVNVAFVPEKGSEYVLMYFVPGDEAAVCSVDIQEVVETEDGSPGFESVVTFPVDWNKRNGGFSKGLCSRRQQHYLLGH